MEMTRSELELLRNHIMHTAVEQLLDQRRADPNATFQQLFDMFCAIPLRDFINSYIGVVKSLDDNLIADTKAREEHFKNNPDKQDLQFIQPMDEEHILDWLKG